MRILHTSDWHLGQTLWDRSRKPEQGAFLTWLKNTITELRVDVLLVSGDIYDNSAPPNWAMTMYYDFLHDVRRLSDSVCRCVIIAGGNHDSPTLLNTTSRYLGLDNIHVVGRAKRDPADEVILVDDDLGRCALAVCAVPYLRPGEVPRSGETDPLLQGKAVSDGVLAHFAAVREKALEKTRNLEKPVPVVAMGHLFANDVMLDEHRDGETNLVVGTLGEIDAVPLSAAFDYVALGHIHRPMNVCGSNVFYSGAPMPMVFGEKVPEKNLLLVEFEDDDTQPPSATGWRGTMRVSPVPVPVFRRLVRLRADNMAELEAGAVKLAEEEKMRAAEQLPAWVVVDYTGQRPPTDWRDRLNDIPVREKADYIFVAQRDLSPRDIPGLTFHNADLSALSPEEVFELCLENQKMPLPDTDKEQVRVLFRLLLAELEGEEDLATQKSEQLAEGALPGVSAAVQKPSPLATTKEN